MVSTKIPYCHVYTMRLARREASVEVERSTRPTVGSRRRRSLGRRRTKDETSVHRDELARSEVNASRRISVDEDSALDILTKLQFNDEQARMAETFTLVERMTTRTLTQRPEPVSKRIYASSINSTLNHVSTENKETLRRHHMQPHSPPISRSLSNYPPANRSASERLANRQNKADCRSHSVSKSK